MIGSGSFGTVHLAMNKSNGALFVVKSAESQAGLISLENEANILEKLNSPHIVQCIGRESSSGGNGNGNGNGERKINLLIEYMAGGSLADVAEKFGGALDERVIRLYTREILEGLKYLHKNGIVHSDLKCKNVLLGSRGNVKLADFGCARKISNQIGDEASMKSFNSVVGTPLWMAPEVLRNEGTGFSADIWSFGCTVIEMATGKSPWGDGISNPMAVVLKIACGNEIPPFPRQFSQEGLDFLGKCLERNPEKRWTAEELLKHPFVSSGKLEEKNSISSPASVLDSGIYNGYYESEDSPDGSEFSSRIPFLGRRNSLRNRRESHLVSSGNWVTVR